MARDIWDSSSGEGLRAPRVAAMPPATPIMPRTFPRRRAPPPPSAPDPQQRSDLQGDRRSDGQTVRRTDGQTVRPEMALVTDMRGECRAEVTPHTVW